MVNFKGHCFEKEFILLNIRWYGSYKLSYRDLVEMALERGVDIAHTTIMRWVQKFADAIDKKVRKGKKPTGGRYFLDETYIKI